MQKNKPDVHQILEQFQAKFSPLEGPAKLVLLIDRRTAASFCECHVKGSTLVQLGTIDAPLDPDEQPDYRANREIRLNHPAFMKMKEDARKGRTFSNIVCEFTEEFDPSHPLKIVGGQHRFQAIEDAVSSGVDEYHGVKVYFNLDMNQRIDVQLISNTNIAISGDLFDRMQETFQGPQLRDWCQSVGLLQPNQDFADQFSRGGPISVRMARSFITNYFDGRNVDPKKFGSTDTTPILCVSGTHDPDWESLKATVTNLWTEKKLSSAGKEFALLAKAQRDFFNGKARTKPDYPEKAYSAAVYSAWAYVAGVLHDNEPRLKRHFSLREPGGTDPLNAAALAKGRHKTDSDTYRGLGYRTDAKERARFTELFFLQAEDGSGITPKNIEIAIKQYHAKQANLEVIKAKEK
jgi:hypothetical protein